MTLPKTRGTGPAGGAFRLTPARVRALLQIADLALIAAGASLARLVMPAAAGEPILFWFAVVCALLVTIDLFAAAGLYRPRHLGRPGAQVWAVTGAWTATQGLLCGFALVAGSGDELSPGFFLTWWGATLIALVALHAMVATVVGRAQRAGRLGTRIVLVGAGPQAASFIQRVRQHDPGVTVVALFDDRRSRVPAAVEGSPVVGTLDDVPAFLRAQQVDQIVITLPQHAASRRLACFEKLRHLPVDVRLSPDLPGLELAGHGMAEVGGVPLLRVFDRPLTGWSRVAKAVEDRVIAALVIALTAPVLVLVAILVRLSSPGPVLFRQRRYGFDNQAIEVLKFRTMHLPAEGAEDAGPDSTRRGDPRVTAIGRLLRRTSLDELPQFLNVLQGQMSLVGPRPERPEFVEQFRQQIPGYMQKHLVKAGITGWAQVNDLRGDSDLALRIQYDLYYIEHWSLWFDLRILVLTLWHILKSRNAR